MVDIMDYEHKLRLAAGDEDLVNDVLELAWRDSDISNDSFSWLCRFEDRLPHLKTKERISFS